MRGRPQKAEAREGATVTRRHERAALAARTTLGLGGEAKVLLEADDERALVAAVAAADEAREPLLLLGGGSNVVIADEGFAGLVICPRQRGVRARRDGDRVRLELCAAEPLDELAARACEEGWSGLEALSGIPGHVGATPIQNVGAYGRDVSQVLLSVRVFDRERGEITTLPADECGFAYRDSIFRRGDRYVILAVELVLGASASSAPIMYQELAARLGVTVGERAPLGAVRRAVLELRRQKGMVVDDHDPESRSVGSFFKNPVLRDEELAAARARARASGAIGASEELRAIPTSEGGFKVPAAWLIERAGFAKGYRRGGVGISRRHALALVHYGGGSTHELLALAAAIRSAVRERFGLLLTVEPILVGASMPGTF